MLVVWGSGTVNRDDGVAGEQGRVDPWAPGGAMSDPNGWMVPGGELASFRSGVDDERVSNWARARLAFAGAAVVGLLAVVVAAWQTSRDSTPTEPAAGSEARTVSGAQTSIGRIEWARLSGDTASLPAAVVAGPDGVLLGRDDDGRVSLVSVDGVAWDRDRAAGDVAIAGVRWSVDLIDGRRSLMQVDGEGFPVVAPVVDDRAARDGTLVSWAVPGTAPSDVLVDAGGGLFARLDRHEQVDWRAVLDLAPSDGYRVHVVSGDDDETFESSAAVSIDPNELTAEMTATGVVLRDSSGREIGTVGAEPMSGGPLDALRPTVSAGWARWDTDRFTVLEPPWAADEVVEVAAIADRILAVATVKLEPGRRVWSTDDGVHWEAADLPIEPSAASPMPMTVGHDEIVLSISDGTSPSYWSTRDAISFERLANVPGINLRSQGSFGWIAPDPRSSPVLRVSPDGDTWTELDLSDQLGYDAARWDGRLDAIAIGAHIYVTSTVGDERTILIGDVNTTSTPG